jgi:hypothetical protein
VKASGRALPVKLGGDVYRDRRRRTPKQNRRKTGVCGSEAVFIFDLKTTPVQGG